MSDRAHTADPSLVSGSVGRAVWFLAWPTIITNVLQTAYGFINMAFVGRLGKVSIAAVGFANVALFWQFGILIGVSVGTSALVARFYGAKTPEQADQVTKQSMLLAVFGALITAVPMVLFDEPILELLGAKPEVIPIAVPYLRIILTASPLFFIAVMATAALRGAGDAKTPLIIMSVQVGLNVLGDWLLIFGIGPFPRLGVEGAAWSTIISRGIAMVLALILLWRSRLSGALRGSFMPNWGWFTRILRIGIPAGLQSLLRTTGATFYYAILGRTAEATAAIAALAIGIQSEALAFTPGFAFGIAATAMVGQNLGANQPARARRSGWIAAGLGLLVMTVMGVVFYVLAEPFARLFTSEQDVVSLATLYLQINAPSEPFLGLAIILTGALNGAGETRVPALFTFISLWVFRIPLTYLLALTAGMGAAGGWISMSVTTGLGGLMTAAYFKWGKWSSVKL